MLCTFVYVDDLRITWSNPLHIDDIVCIKNASFYKVSGSILVKSE